MNRLKLNPNLIAVICGCVFCIVLWSAGEAALWLLEKLHPGPTEEAPIYPNGFFKRDEFGIFRAAQGSHRCFHKDPKGQFIYDRHYAIDEYGRRSTPVAQGERDRFIAFLGCSFTFGEGIGDDQTLPYHVGQLAPQYMPYNYGMMGLGPFDILAKIEHVDFKTEIKEPHGIFIYVFMADHLSRIMGSMDAMSWNFNGCYYHKSSEGKLVRHGDYRTGRWAWTKIYTLLTKSRILRALRVHLPIRIGDDDLKLVADTAQAMDAAIRQKYSGSTFYVVIYPGPHPPRLAQYIRAKGVKVLDYTTLFSAYDPMYYMHKDDQHPSELAYQTIAQHIVSDLHLGQDHK